MDANESIKEGVELAARYALMPSKLGFCRNRKEMVLIENVFANYLEGKVILDDLEAELRKLPTCFAYLNLIARACNKEIFDHNVVEAYWVGNELLENFDSCLMEQFLLERLIKRKLPEDYAKGISKTLAQDTIPHHSFHVLLERFALGKTNSELSIMNNCRIGWGQIFGIKDETLNIIASEILFNCENKFELIEKYENKKTAYKLGKFKSIDEPRIGDWVSMHWGFAVQRLNEKQLGNLKKYTNRNLGALNKLNGGCKLNKSA